MLPCMDQTEEQQQPGTAKKTISLILPDPVLAEVQTEVVKTRGILRRLKESIFLQKKKKEEREIEAKRKNVIELYKK